MEPLLPYLTAFVVGLLGGVHCIGMCGGIVGSLTLGLDPAQRQSLGRLLPYQLLYNLGRILSYLVAGAVMGGMGMLLGEMLPIEQAQNTLLFVAGLFMLLLGLYLSGWWMVLNRVERVGGFLWRQLEPLGRALLPIRSSHQALMVGLLWGWVPCGLVYTMLINAISTGSATGGALLMLAFGIGTLPNLMMIGLVTGLAARLAKSRQFKLAAGLIVMLFGLYTLGRSLGLI